MPPCQAPSIWEMHYFHASAFGDNSNLQAVIGSAPSADGNFDRNNNFSTVFADGLSNVSLAMVNEHAGQAAYIIPASKCEPSFHDAFDIVNIVNIIAACLYLHAATPILTLVSYLYCSCPVCPSDSRRPHASALLLSSSAHIQPAGHFHYWQRIRPGSQPCIHMQGLPYLAKLSVNVDAVDGYSIFTSVWLLHGRHGLVLLSSP